MLSKIKLVIKNGLHHGRNLGFFILIYKSICWICRQRGLKGGIESWIAGFIGGFIAFGDSTGLSGGVNNQIVLYLFSRYGPFPPFFFFFLRSTRLGLQRCRSCPAAFLTARNPPQEARRRVRFCFISVNDLPDIRF